MMTLRHDDMMERSPLPPQAGNTRFSYNDRGAHWESSGRRNEKMMISGRANSMSPPLGVSSKNGGGLLPPATPMFRNQRLAATAKRFPPRCSPEQSG